MSVATEEGTPSLPPSDDAAPTTDESSEASFPWSNDRVDFEYVPSSGERALQANETRDQRLSSQSKALQRAMFAMIRQLKAFDSELKNEPIFAQVESSENQSE